MNKILTPIFWTIYLVLLTLSTTAFPNSKIYQNHENIGCPENSICSKEMGELILEYENSLKESKLTHFYKNHGIPVSGIRKKIQNPTEKNIYEAVWDSPCDYRKEKKSNYEQVQIFTKNLKSAPLIFPQYILINQEGKLTTFYASNDDSVLGVEDNNLIFNRLIEDQYYQYQINSKGDIFPSKEVEIKTFGKKVVCTKELITQISGLFQPVDQNRINCRQIYDSKGKKSYLFYLPRCE